MDATRGWCRDLPSCPARYAVEKDQIIRWTPRCITPIDYSLYPVIFNVLWHIICIHSCIDMLLTDTLPLSMMCYFTLTGRMVPLERHRPPIQQTKRSGRDRVQLTVVSLECCKATILWWLKAGCVIKLCDLEFLAHAPSM